MVEGKRAMYAEIEYSDRNFRSPSAATPGMEQTHPTMPRSFTPPRLHAVDSAATQTAPRLTIADLRLPAELVRARASQYTAFARAQGAPHSMRLWRVGYQQAMRSLARESAGVAENAPCLAFFWQQHGREYLVSASFGQLPLPRLQ